MHAKNATSQTCSQDFGWSKWSWTTGAIDERSAAVAEILHEYPKFA
jgi:hypothetical protein